MKDNVEQIKETRRYGNRLYVSSRVVIRGTIEDEFVYSHQIYKTNLYRGRVCTRRKNGNKDYINVIAPENVLSEIVSMQAKGKAIEVAGEIRSYDEEDKNNIRRLNVVLLAKELKIFENGFESDENIIYMEGYIGTRPNYRVTPNDKKMVEMVVAVNRENRKTAYIPCVAWERVADEISSYEIGRKIVLYGKIHSRKYLKNSLLNPEDGEWREVFEVIITKLIY